MHLLAALPTCRVLQPMMQLVDSPLGSKISCSSRVRAACQTCALKQLELKQQHLLRASMAALAFFSSTRSA